MLDSNEIFNTGCAKPSRNLRLFLRLFSACFPSVQRRASRCSHLLTSHTFAAADAEGDGGVIYNGMDLSGGYGMQFLHNFIHHTLEIPG